MVNELLGKQQPKAIAMVFATMEPDVIKDGKKLSFCWKGAHQGHHITSFHAKMSSLRRLYCNRDKLAHRYGVRPQEIGENKLVCQHTRVWSWSGLLGRFSNDRQ